MLSFIKKTYFWSSSYVTIFILVVLVVLLFVLGLGYGESIFRADDAKSKNVKNSLFQELTVARNLLLKASNELPKSGGLANAETYLLNLTQSLRVELNDGSPINALMIGVTFNAEEGVKGRAFYHDLSTLNSGVDLKTIRPKYFYTDIHSELKKVNGSRPSRVQSYLSKPLSIDYQNKAIKIRLLVLPVTSMSFSKSAFIFYAYPETYFESISSELDVDGIDFLDKAHTGTSQLSPLAKFKKINFLDSMYSPIDNSATLELTAKNNQKQLLNSYYRWAVVLSGLILMGLLFYTLAVFIQGKNTKTLDYLTTKSQDHLSPSQNDFSLGGILMECALTIDLDGRIKFVNQDVVNLLAYPQDMMIGKHFDTLFKPSGDGFDVESWKDSKIYRQILAGHPYETEAVTLCDASGREVQVALRAVPLSKNQQSYGAMLAFRDITNIKKTHYEIWRRANFDGLTNLPNRNLFFDRLSLELKKSLRGNLSLGLMFIDLDRFKEVNDTYGHHVGDKLLIEIASRISECVRDSDTVARLGGDEFTVILTQQADILNIERVARKILHNVSEPILIADIKFKTSCSIGIAIAPQDAADMQELVNFADEAMYSAKKLGRNQLHFFTQPLRDAMNTRITVVNDLQSALAEGQFLIEYQPIVDTASSNVAMYEALVRWVHPQKGTILPNEFIKPAEEAGLIVSLGNWVFKQVINDLLAYSKRNNDFCPVVTINVSPLQFKLQEDCAKNWVRMMQEAGILGDRVVIEITESMILEDSLQITKNIEGLRAYGVSFALDDFGTGYSSMSYLKKFDIQYLKIDKSFVIGAKTSSSDRAIVEGIVGIAHKLDIQVVAEGVEETQQFDYLRGVTCDYVQGYLLGRPQPLQ